MENQRTLNEIKVIECPIEMFKEELKSLMNIALQGLVNSRIPKIEPAPNQDHSQKLIVAPSFMKVAIGVIELYCNFGQPY
jgi:hypothetical protein